MISTLAFFSFSLSENAKKLSQQQQQEQHVQFHGLGLTKMSVYFIPPLFSYKQVYNPEVPLDPSSESPVPSSEVESLRSVTAQVRLAARGETVTWWDNGQGQEDRQGMTATTEEQDYRCVKEQIIETLLSLKGNCNDFYIICLGFDLSLSFEFNAGSCENKCLNIQVHNSTCTYIICSP